jgi:[ribosomal protein S18]-alanine N-acetyltransferase
MFAMGITLAAFEAAHMRTVLSWVRSAEEAATWASVPGVPDGPEVFGRWHAEPWAHPRIALLDGRAVAYGEVWEDDGEAELARLIVDPAERGKGVGRRLASLLSEEAVAMGYDAVWVRVVPSNAAALAAYRAAGFADATEAQEREFNAGQPQAYRWLLRRAEPGTERGS